MIVWNILLLALLILSFGPVGGVLGSTFRHPENHDDDITALLKRMEALETKVERQQELIESLETRVASTNRILATDEECYLTFFNETGTPTCRVNYHLTAGKQIDYPSRT